MSTILKALRRLEREKAVAADAQTLREAVAAGGADPGPSRRWVWLMAGLALLFGIGIGAGVLLFWPAGEVELVASAANVPVDLGLASEPATRASPTPAERAELLELDRVEDPGPPEQAFSSQVAVVYRPERKPRIPLPEAVPERVSEPVADPPLQGAGTVGRTAVSEPEQVVAQVPAGRDPWLDEAPDPSLAVPAPEPVPATTLPEPPPALERAAPRRPSAAAPGPAPAAHEAAPLAEPAEPAPRADSAPSPARPVPPSEPTRDAAPMMQESASGARQTNTRVPAPAAAPVRQAEPVRVERTWWHPLPERREAELRLGDDAVVRVREGERVGDALVTRIEPSGVLFSGEDGEFRRGVGAAADD